MFDNPIFQYAGVRGGGSVEPTIVSLANTTDVDEEVSLFYAQENLVKDNFGLPEGVVANAEYIFEMPSEQLFTCFEPLVGFNPQTTFALKLDNGSTLDQFQVLQTIDSFKSIVLAFNGVENATLYKLSGVPPRIILDATAEFSDVLFNQSARFVFSVTSLEQATKGFELDELVVSNSTTYPCLDRFSLSTTQTGFNSSDSTNASTYQEVLQSTNFSPFGLESLVIQSPNMTAIAENPVKVIERDANGNRQEQQVTLLRSPYMRPGQRVISNIREIDGATEVQLTLPKRTTATLFLYDKYRMQP